MAEFTLDRRSLVRSVGAAGGLSLLSAAAEAASDDEPPVPDTDPHTQLTYAAVTDAVIPRTPELADDLGDEHVPGGLETGLDAYLVEYVNTLFSGLTPVGDRTGDLRLAEVVATVLEEAAVELLARGRNDDQPSPRFVRELTDRSTTLGEAVDVAAAGLFPRLSRRDRLNALTLFDEKELDVAQLATDTPLPLVESDGGLVPTLLVGFTEVVYYSEWQGYEDISVPPSERAFTNDDDAVQSWRQTDFPGFADGYAAFRGYWGGDDVSLGAGDVWDEVGERTITFESGEFRDNEYDTSGYEEVFPTDGEPATEDPLGTGQTGGDAPSPPEAPTGGTSEDGRPGDGGLLDGGLLDAAGGDR
ncbi:hypothetical protein [Halorarius halobius]|uniref:hypothetical protein n=1 Tax=Halorarius halobius TaxID=2962671 RepID=UPI0020CDD2DA|nr:hypothetical protein [Halorarius halobius]